MVTKSIRFGIFSVLTDRRLSEEDLISCNFNVKRLAMILFKREKENRHPKKKEEAKVKILEKHAKKQQKKKKKPKSKPKKK